MDIALVVLAIAVVAAALILAFAIVRGRPAAERSDPRLDSVITAQGAIGGQFQQTIAAQALLSQRIEALNQRLGESLKENTNKTAATLGSIGERLNVIDAAQKNIT